MTVTQHHDVDHGRSHCDRVLNQLAHPAWLLTVATFVVASLAIPFSSLLASDTDTQSPTALAAEKWTRVGWPLLENYCVDCHSSDNAEAEVDLSNLKTLAGVQQNSELAIHTISMIRFAAMPPEDADLPSSDERRELADLLDALVFHAACDMRPRPGRTTARRLNRAEYNNAIRDLFGVDFRPADSFPSDEVGGGFDNNADVLSLSTMLMDKYLTAAEEITAKVIVDPESLPKLDQTFTGETLSIIGPTKTGGFGQRYTTASGMAWIDVEVPVRGRYQIEVIASPRSKSNSPVLSTMHTADGKLRAIFEHEFREDSGDDDHESTRMTLDAGKHRLFFRTTMVPAKKRDELKDDPDWQVDNTVYQAIVEMNTDELEQTRVPTGTTLKPDKDIDFEEFPMRYRSVIVKGPEPATREDLPAGQKTLLGRLPERRGDQYRNVGGPAKEALRPLLRRAFRSEISDDDLKPYVSLVEKMCDRGDSYYEAMQIAISAALVSPRFLFRVEVPETDQQRQAANAGEPIALSSTQLASRLSFFLWSSLPDEKLLDAARRNELSDPKKRMQHVDRMLADPKSNSLGTQFAHQWFGLGNLQSLDLSEFASVGKNKLDADQVSAQVLAAETEQLFLHLLRENRPIAELLTSETTFVNPTLAQWYGVAYPESAGSDVAEVRMADQGRRGILGHAGVLLLTSYPTRNSPVQRGKWILENILGTPPPEAPPGVPGLEETKTAAADATLREQLELHRADPGCASCHRVMDSLGFGLEDFDHFGRLRAADDPARGDASGELPGGRQFTGAGELATILATTEARGLAETAVRRMLSFAIGRELRPSDRCFVEAILEQTQADQYRVRDLLDQVLVSPPFLNHQAELPSS
jgi:hypothetical protein